MQLVFGLFLPYVPSAPFALASSSMPMPIGFYNFPMTCDHSLSPRISAPSGLQLGGCSRETLARFYKDVDILLPAGAGDCVLHPRDGQII